MSNESTALRVPVFGQRTAECGNTSLKAVCWFLGRQFSARQLGRLAGLSADGIDHDGLVEAARATGARVVQRRGGSISFLRAALRDGLPPIVGWWSRDDEEPEFDQRWSLRERRANDCGHYSVVCGIDRARVELMDPQWGYRRGSYGVIGRRWMPIKDFLRAWYDTDTERYIRVDRWSMTLWYPVTDSKGTVPKSNGTRSSFLFNDGR
jgi:ABC-type bacteriocin/lantibiotic exporter with double-glycine peptidase domain